jgi:glycosyltransferase involved in cell wall biosynthesis
MTDNRPIAVTITPVAAMRDSRSLKQAGSLAQAGYRSVLFEGQRSDRAIELPNVDIVGMSGGMSGERDKARPSSQVGIGKWIALFRKRATAPDASWLEARIGFFIYLAFYARHFLIGGLRHIPPASVYYLNEFSFFPAVWIKSWLHGASLIYDAHDFYTCIEPSALQTPFQKLVVGFGRRIERRCIREAKAFTTVGNGVADLYNKEFGRCPEVIRNAHDTRIDRKPARSIRERAQLSGEQCLVVVIGQAKLGQEFSGLFGALKSLPHLHVALVGNGYRNLLSETAQRNCVVAQIHYVENVPATEIVPLIRDADASLIVYYARSENYKNALPNGFFQSVAAGLPVLYSELPEITKICRELDFGISVRPDDATGLTMLLQKVIDRSDWYKDQKNRSEKAASVLTWQNEEKKLIQLLATTLR